MIYDFGRHHDQLLNLTEMHKVLQFQPMKLFKSPNVELRTHSFKTFCHHQSPSFQQFLGLSVTRKPGAEIVFAMLKKKNHKMCQQACVCIASSLQFYLYIDQKSDIAIFWFATGVATAGVIVSIPCSNSNQFTIIIDEYFL